MTGASWAWQAHLYLLGETALCAAWLHESCREGRTCVCRCHGRQYAPVVIERALEAAA